MKTQRVDTKDYELRFLMDTNKITRKCVCVNHKSAKFVDFF